MNEWISVEDKLPTISYLESNNENDPYECYPVLVFCPEKPGIFCVAHLEMNQDENSFNYKELSWRIYIPKNGTLEEVDFDAFTHWRYLPDKPQKQD